MFCLVKFASHVSLLATVITVSAMPEQGVYLPALKDGTRDNKTIVIGYFVNPEVRTAVIGMAIEQAQTDGLLPGYGFR